MALVGLDKVYVSKLTIGESGATTYGTPMHLANAIDASIAPAVDTQNVYADDTVAEIISVKSNIEVSFTFADIGSEKYAMLLGKEKDANGVVIDKDSDEAPYFALMFRSKKSNGEYRYVVLYKGKFNEIEQSFATQQGNADYQTQPLTATFVKSDAGHWSARVDSDDAGVAPSTIDGWFESVYQESELAG